MFQGSGYLPSGAGHLRAWIFRVIRVIKAMKVFTLLWRVIRVIRVIRVHEGGCNLLLAVLTFTCSTPKVLSRLGNTA
jgi:hypothetical protein